MTFRILVTGTREALTRAEQLRVRDAIGHYVLASHDRIVLVHGHCPTGVDAYVNGLESIPAKVWVERHPADWEKHGRAAGPLRNKHMVDLGADVCLAFPKGTSRGTRGCLRLAEQAGIETRVFEL